MATQVQFRRGTTTETNLFTGAVGEVTVDTTKNVCVVHDGSTSGGFPLLRQDGTNSLLSSGSLSSPSLKFSNSITTGIYSPSPGSISIVNNGVANLTIDSSGAVNIPGNFLLSGNLSLPQGTVASPSLKIGPGTQGFYSPTTEQLAISIGSTQSALFTGQLFNWGAPTGDCGIQIGDGATANRAAYLDLVGDTTYTDYGLRLIRNNAGPNASSVLTHRGTGGLTLRTEEAAPITFQTTGLERARIDSSGRLLVGTSSSSTYLTGITATLQSIESSGTALALGLERPAADSSGANIGFRKTRSTTPGGVGIVLSGDQIGQLRFIATDGANPIQAAGIQSVVDGTPGLNDMPGRLVFTTTPAGSSTPVERMRIGSTGVIAIGTTGTTGGASGSVLRLGGDITGATSTAATLSTPTVRSGVTSAAIVFASQPSVEDIAFTCGELTHFRALQSTIGATATVTNQIGFLAHSSIVGATNNYGFYGNIPSGTGRWNFYAAGTADSYFASNNFIFANGGTERARFDSSGRLLLGTSTGNLLISGTLPYFQIHGTVSSTSTIAACRWSADVNQSFVALSKSRGATVGTQAAVASGDTIGTVVFTADDGTSFIQAARISALVDGTPGTNDMPGRLIFSTTPSGSVNPVERMRIDSAGNIGIGGATSAGYSFLNSKTLTGATTTYGQVNQGTVQSDCTSAFYYASSASTQAAAFTVGTLVHYQALQGTFGAGSAVTDQFGFRVNSSLIGATNNYGFYGNIPSGTGRWNFYAAGTADSYFASNNFIFANGGTERARFDSSGRLLVGTSTSTNTRNYLSADIGGPSLQIQGITQGSSALSSFCWSSTSNAPATLVLNKSISGAIGTRGALNAAGTDIGSITFNGDDGANFIPAAAILAAVDGTPGTNDMPGRLVFSTTADGASTPTEQWRINNGGTVIYNQPAPAAINTTATLTVANLTAKIITSTTAAAVTMTLPLGTDMDTGFSGTYTNMAFEWAVINTGATNAVTIQANTGHTIVGSATVAASNSGRFLCRRTAANTWVTYRLSS